MIQNDTSLSDSVRASYCANYWSLEHKVRIVKRNINSSLITLEELKKMMPNATHPGILVNELFDEAKKDKCDLLLAGQNADTFYNFGPTTKISFKISSMADTFRRFYLTKPFTSYFDNLKTSKRSFSFISLLIFVGSKVYSLLKGQKFDIPKNKEEALNAYMQTLDYTYFKSSTYKKFYDIDLKSTFYENLLMFKVNNFIMSGAPQVIHNYGKKYSIDTFLPYSDEIMLNIFASIERDLRDVFFPKRFIYQGVRKLDKVLFKKVSKVKIKRMINYHKWIKIYFPNFLTENFKGDFNDAGRFNSNLNKYWTS